MSAELLIKSANKYPPDHSMYEYGWKIGQLINIRPEGYYGENQRKHHAVITVPTVEYEQFHGTIPYLGTNAAELKKLLYVAENNKYPWDTGYIDPHAGENKIYRRRRDWFVDFQFLVNSGFITADQLEKILDHKVDPGPIVIEKDIFNILFHEDVKTRISTPWIGKIGSVSTGTYTVGTGQDYTDWSDAEADVAASLTGDLTFSGNTSAGIAEGTDIVWDTETGSYTLKLTVHADHRHSGVYTTLKHYIDFASYDSFTLDEVIEGHLANVILEYLQFDASGVGNEGIFINDCGTGGNIIVQKNIIKSGQSGIYIADSSGVPDNILVVNNILFDSIISGIRSSNEYYDVAWSFYNNTIMDSADVGFREVAGSIPATSMVLKNNLVYGSTNYDYAVADAWTNITTAKNVSGDNTSPDGATYQNWAGTGNMTNYAGDDFTLDSTDSTLDDGDDLSGTFTDDVQDQTRSTWYIGASEFIGGGGGNTPTGTIYGPLMGPLGGPV